MNFILVYYLIFHSFGVMRYWSRPLKMLWLCAAEVPIFWGLLCLVKISS